MAIIKCPECGRQISDKAPTCPSCGVEIAGKITKCPHCGEVYFNYLDLCPNCHAATTADSPAATPVTTPPIPPRTPSSTTPPPVPPKTETGKAPEQEEKPQKKSSGKMVFIISFVFAVIVCGVMYYFYDSANKNREMEAYEYAMKSSDPMVLQSFLDNYKDADQAHIDSIQAHLNLLKQVDTEWTNAVVSGSKEALEAYIQKYPNSPHKKEAWDKIDSIDWNVAQSADNAEAYQLYLDEHADGNHIEEAENALKKVLGRDLQPEEEQMVTGLFKRFFQSINAHNTDGLTATCEDVLSSLLGKNSATKSDVAMMMEKLYKEDVSNMNWHINNDYQIKKREIGNTEYEYQVQFTARQDVDHVDGSKASGTYKITATVSPDGKVSSFNMAKINTEE